MIKINLIIIKYSIIKSADPGLCQGRGGAWDHRRCGICFCRLATTLPFASSASHQGHSHISCMHIALTPLFARPQPSPTLCGSFDQTLRPQPSVVKGVQACRLPAFKPLKPLKGSAAASCSYSSHSHLFLRAFKDAPKTLRGSFDQALRPQPSVVKGVQACRLPGFKPLKPLKRQLRVLAQEPSLFTGLQGRP